MRKQVALSAFILASVPLTVPFGMRPAGAAPAPDCLAAPNAPSPQGRHWYYRVDRVNKRRCWYLGPQGTKPRPDTSQAAAQEPGRTAWPTPQPAAPAPAEQPTMGEIVRRLNGAPAAEATVGMAEATAGTNVPEERLAAAAPPQPKPATPDERTPASATAANSDAPSKADDADAPPRADASTDEMPLIWPVPTATDLATAPPPTTALQLASMLALLAGSLAFAGLAGRAVLKHAADRRFGRHHVLPSWR
jgi:hypothetical protein